MGPYSVYVQNPGKGITLQEVETLDAVSRIIRGLPQIKQKNGSLTVGWLFEVYHNGLIVAPHSMGEASHGVTFIPREVPKANF